MSAATQQRLRGTMLTLAALILLVAISPPNVLGNVLRRSFMGYNTYTNNQNTTECRLRSPCGWFMYHPVERNYVHYLQVCTCPSGMRCLPDRDDVTISCWVYTCKVAPPDAPTLPPGFMNIPL